MAVAALSLASPAAAELTRVTDDGFVSRHEVVVEASPKDAWLALIAPAGWWRSEHTWSGDAANLTLTPQAGGCFCETIPEVDEPGRFTLQGSVEHMRVIQAYPETALRMQGALGPLQSEPVTGILTITISTVEQGTRIVWEYNVGGTMRYEVPVISKAVDGVMGAQLTALADLLGPVAMPDAAPASDPAEGPVSSEDPAPAGADGGAEAEGKTTEAAKTTAVPVIRSRIPAPSAVVDKPASVDDAFGDLEDSQPRA
ncbi:hypothetical protein [Porphyrobacter sp. AAP60]|uniref:hypothetical protein n=1 Tax=Porphyrobacter sp. AAP60 TaxID=1523423 RepID=UPI0006B93951|nr:hypothetical protein [Porphyrobacter sp. AAP60]KPF64494.1 hypothetical protein IP79_04990 [Porphyrobacter sp. AAP60]